MSWLSSHVTYHLIISDDKTRPRHLVLRNSSRVQTLWSHHLNQVAEHFSPAVIVLLDTEKEDSFVSSDVQGTVVNDVWTCYGYIIFFFSVVDNSMETKIGIFVSIDLNSQGGVSFVNTSLLWLIVMKRCHTFAPIVSLVGVLEGRATVCIVKMYSHCSDLVWWSSNCKEVVYYNGTWELNRRRGYKLFIHPRTVEASQFQEIWKKLIVRYYPRGVVQLTVTIHLNI